MCVWMTLWVVKDRQIVLQIGCLDCCFGGERVFFAEAHHNSIVSQQFNMQVRMR